MCLSTIYVCVSVLCVFACEYLYIFSWYVDNINVCFARFSPIIIKKNKMNKHKAIHKHTHTHTYEMANDTKQKQHIYKKKVNNSSVVFSAHWIIICTDSGTLFSPPPYTISRYIHANRSQLKSIEKKKLVRNTLLNEAIW